MDQRTRELDVSDLLKPGVYTLSLHGRVVFIGKARCMFTAIMTHRQVLAADPELRLPIRRIQFDGISIIPCAADKAKPIYDALIAHHNPVHNRVHSPHTSTSTPPPTHSPTIARRI